MKWIRLSAPFTLGLFISIVALLLLSRSETVLEAQSDWPPIHKNLSASYVDSTNADIEVAKLQDGSKVVVVVWMEGQSDVEIIGSIKMRWKFEGQTGTWRISSSQMFPVAEGGNAYGYPALALYPSGNQVYAHVVWLKKDSQNNQQIVYKRCTLTKTNVTCDSAETISWQNSTAPDIAVDGSGVPHVVWQQKIENLDAIYYTNKPITGTWGIPWAIHTPQGVLGVDYLRALGQSPKIAVYGAPGTPGSVVAVTWDRQIAPVGTGEPPGLFNYLGTWFARRDTLGQVGTGDEEADHWELTPISQPSASTIQDEIEDSRPRLAAGQTGIYVMWDRLISQGPGMFVFTRTYDLAYRVFLPPFTNTVKTGWWPGPEAIPSTSPYIPSYQAPYSATTWVPAGVAGTDQDLYSGARPAVQIARSGSSDQLHIAWQRSADIGTGSMATNGSADLGISGEGDVNDYPLQVWHAVATHTLSSGNMAVSAWASRQITVQQPVNGFFAAPDLAVLAGDGPPHPHIALLDRFKTTSAYAWDVWYVNDKTFNTADRDPTIYLPIVLKNYY